MENVKRFGVVVVAGGLCYFGAAFGAAFANQAHALMLALIVLVQHERYSTWILAGLLVIALEWREIVREATKR